MTSVPFDPLSHCVVCPTFECWIAPIVWSQRNQRNEWPAILVGNRCVSGPCGNRFCFVCSLCKDNRFGITALKPAEPKAAASTSHPWKNCDGRYPFNRVVYHPVQGNRDRTYRNCMGALFVHRVYHRVTSGVPV